MVYRELVDSFLRIILSGIFLVVAKGTGSIAILVDSFFSRELLVFLDHADFFFLGGFPRAVGSTTKLAGCL